MTPQKKSPPFLIAVAAFLCLALGACSTTSPRHAAAIRHDGIYGVVVKDKENDYTEYLRFYPDGTVVDASLENPVTAQEAGGMVQPNHKYSQGHYTVEGSKISFVTISQTGRVSYWGNIMPDFLVLSSHSYINGYKDTGVRFDFFPLK